METGKITDNFTVNPVSSSKRYLNNIVSATKAVKGYNFVNFLNCAV